MPYKYVIEAFCDMVGAGKAYNISTWTRNSPLDYWERKCEGKRLMHSSSEYLLKYLLIMMDILGEKKFYAWYRDTNKVLKENYKDDFKTTRI